MTTNGHEDKALIERFLAGDRAAINQLIRKWHKVFCERSYWITKDRSLACDVAQDCWLTIIHTVEALQDKEKFKSWALRIVYTKSIDAVKQNQRQQSVIDSLASTEATTEDKPQHTTDTKAKLMQAIQQLSKDKQDVIRLFYHENFTIKEISQFLNISVGTVKSRLFHAREQLKSHLKSLNHE